MNDHHADGTLKLTLYNKWYSKLKGLTPEDPLIRYLNFPELLAHNSTNYLFGNSFTFSTDDKALLEFWDDFVIKTRLQIVIERLIYNLSKYGEIILGFDQLTRLEKKEKCKGFRIYTSRPQYFTHKRFVYENLESATFITEKKPQMINGQYLPILIKEEVSRSGTTRTFWFVGPDAVFGSPLPEKDRKRNPELAEIDKFVPNKFIDKNGNQILPLQDFTNYSFSNAPEWALCEGLIKDYVAAKDYEERERKTNKTRVIINVNDERSRQELEKVIKEGKDEDRFLLTLPIMSGGYESINERLVVVPSTFDLQAHVASQAEKLAMIFSFTGHTFKTSTNYIATATEVQHNTSNRAKSVMRKRKHFNDNMRLFLEALFAAAGFEKSEFAFSLHENEAITQQDKLNQVVSSCINGLSSKLEGIAKLNNISKGDARVKLAEIEQEEQRKFNIKLELDKKRLETLGPIESKYGIKLDQLNGGKSTGKNKDNNEIDTKINTKINDDDRDKRESAIRKDEAPRYIKNDTAQREVRSKVHDKFRGPDSKKQRH